MVIHQGVLMANRFSLSLFVAFLSALLTAGCQTANQQWVRVDGSPGTPAELKQAKAICDADRSFDVSNALLGVAAGLSSVNNPEAAAGYRSQMSPERPSPKACMARLGYIVQ